VILGASAPAKRHDVPEKHRLILPFLFMFLLCFCYLSFIFCLISTISNFLRGLWGFAVLQDALAVRIWSIRVAHVTPWKKEAGTLGDKERLAAIHGAD